MKKTTRSILIPGAFVALLATGCWFLQPTKNASHASTKNQAPSPSTIIVPRQVASTSSAAPVRNESDSVTFTKGDPGTEPAWAVKHGKEWWRTASAKPSQGTAAAPFNVGDVIDRARNEVGTDKNAPLTTRANTYSAEFDGDGVRVRPFAPTEKGLKPNSTELALRTQQIKIGKETIYSADTQAPSQWSVTGNVAQTELAPGLVEHFETRNEGTAITWVLNEKPAAAGDLTVFMAADGMHVLTKTDSGIHFADASGKARVRVGNVTVVDSAGKRTPAQMIPSGNGIAVTVPAALLASASYPIAIDPVVSPEITLDEPVVQEQSADQSNPVISGNSNAGWIVVWEDQRNVETAGTDIYGVKIASSGDIQKSLILCGANAHQVSPRISFNGSVWLVVWQDQRDIATNGYDIYGITVDSDGDLATETPLCTATSNQSGFQLESSGGKWLLAWADDRNKLVTKDDIYGAILSEEAGEITVGDEITLCTALLTQSKLRISGNNGGKWLAVWQDNRNSETTDLDIYGIVVSALGTVGPELTLCVTNGSQYDPRINNSDADWLVIWTDERDFETTSSDIYGRLVAPDSSLGNELALCTNSARQSDPDITSTGNDWFIAWNDYRNFETNKIDIYGITVTSNGTQNSEFAVATTASNELYPVVSTDDYSWFVVWMDDRNEGSTGTDIYGKDLSFTGVAGPATPLSTAPGEQYFPSICTSDNVCFAIWTDEGSGSKDVYGTALFTKGFVQLGVHHPASLSAINDPSQNNQQVSSNGTDWLVVWQDNRNPDDGSDIFGVKVSGAGVGGSLLTLCEADGNQIEPRVSSAGANWLIVWQDNRTDTYGDAYGVTVSGAGAIGTEIPLKTGITSQNNVRAASNGTDWLVIWYEGNASGDIYGKIVSGTGVPGSELTISDADGAQYDARVAASGSNWLVVWKDERDSVESDIYGAIVSGAGEVGPNLAIAVAEGFQFEATLSGNGSGWLVTWMDGRNFDSTGNDIYGAIVSGAGVVGANLPICNVEGYQGSPQSASHGTDWFVAWEDSRDENADSIYGSKVSNTGTVGANILLTTSNDYPYRPIVAGFASGWLVTWSDDSTGAAAWIDGTGTIRSEANGFAIGSPIEGTRVAPLTATSNTLLTVSTTVEGQYTGPSAVVANKVNVPPVIDFPAIPARNFSVTPFAVTATSTSNVVPVTFSIISGSASVNGSMITLSGSGSITVRASQVGADPVEQIFSVAPVITFTAIPTKNFSRTPFTLAASSISNATITFTKISGPVTISGNKVTMTGLGAVKIRASQTGAASVDKTFTIKDTTKPVLKAVSKSITTTTSTAKVTATLTDNYSAKFVEYRLQAPGKAFTAWTKKTLAGTASSKNWTQNFATSTKGKYTLQTRPIDFSNNIGTTIQITITRK